MAAEAVISALLSGVIKKSAPLIIKQFGVALGFDKELEKLRRTLLAIQSVLGDAELRQFKDKGVKSWLAALKDAAYDAEDILDRFNTEVLLRKLETQDGMIMNEVRRFFSLRNPILFRFKMGCKLKHIVERIDEIDAERAKFNFKEGMQPQIMDRPQTYSYVDESAAVGREVDKEEIVKMLIGYDDRNSENFAVLSIVGMGGLGKTTLAQLVYKDQRVEKHFQLLIWVSVSVDFNVENLTKAIINSATGKDCGLSNNMELLQRSLRQVLSGKRYLLVLDDVWNEDPEKWDMLAALLRCGGEGSKIIVTTRSGRVSQVMGTSMHYPLDWLSEDDSWTLFEKRAFASDAQQPPNLVAIGREIVKMCGGLPLALKALGSLMRSKSEVREWLSIKESEIWDLEVGQDGILPALRLSYSHLPPHLKQCFAFCAIFPKDHEIEKEKLIQLWMANGFIPSEGRMELEVKGHEIFSELAWRSFLHDVKEVKKYYYDYGSTITCKMHDLMHDLAQSVMGDECYAMPGYGQLKEIPKKIRHLSISQAPTLSHIYEAIKNSPTLRTFLFEEDFTHYRQTVVVEKSKSKYLRVLGWSL